MSMRALIVYPTMVIMTIVLGVPIVVLSLLGVHIAPDSFLGRAPRVWSRAVLRASAVRLTVRNPEHIGAPSEARMYVSNHVSWFEIFGLACVLPHYRFVAKKELASIPVFGRAAKEVAAIFIDRKNRKAAFQTYAKPPSRSSAAHPWPYSPKARAAGRTRCVHSRRDRSCSRSPRRCRWCRW